MYNKFLLGDKNDELKRDKDRQKTANNVISNLKAIKSKSSTNSKNTNSDLARALLNLPSKTLTLNSSMESTSMTKTSKTKKNINKYEDLNLFRKDKYEVYQRIKKADSFVKDQQANNLMEKLRQIEDFL